MASPIFGEFMGTMIMMLLGNAGVAAALLKRSKGEGSGWTAITGGWAFAVMAGVFTAIACGSRDANLNPAVTMGFAVSTGSFAKFFPYAAAQLLGAFCGNTLVWLHFHPHWNETDDCEAIRACFCTSPAIHKFPMNLMSEIIATFVLVFVAGAIFSKTVAGTGLATGLAPYLVGSLVWGIGLGLGGTTGYAINPARDLGPRIAHSLLPIRHKGPSDWGYAFIPIVGPLIGATLAGILIRIVHF